MGEKEDYPSKKEESNPIKEEILEEEGKKLSRDIARKYIYVRNKEKYPLPFEEYKIYHIDGKLFNDSPGNLYLCTKEQRNALYAEQLKRRKPFSSAIEIDLFLEKIGKNSPEISKDRRIYERGYNAKIPLYWKQKESRKRQVLPPEDPHPELREKIIKEIQNKEEEIKREDEEKRFYSLPPKRHPELKKQLIQEIREAERKHSIEHKRIKTNTEKIIIIIGILVVIAIFFLIFKNSIFNSDKDATEISKNYNTNSEIKSSSEQLLDYDVRTERYFILIINNEKEDLNIEIEYNRYSKALHVDENKTIQVYVRANEESLFKDSGFSKEPGCIENDCTVKIISSRTI
ncbi:MAG: hypothetical protein ACP5NZ_02500 [Nanobdellota archaeon]